jgi:excinuclease UvrABC nuclease subunit
MLRPRARTSCRSQSTWSTYSVERLPKLPGVYAIFRREAQPTSDEPGKPLQICSVEPDPPRLVYIGSANNVRARLQDFGLAKRWTRRICHFGEVDRLTIKVAINRTPLQHLTREARLISRLKPPMNRNTWRSHK